MSKYYDVADYVLNDNGPIVMHEDLSPIVKWFGEKSEVRNNLQTVFGGQIDGFTEACRLVIPKDHNDRILFSYSETISLEIMVEHVFTVGSPKKLYRLTEFDWNEFDAISCRVGDLVDVFHWLFDDISLAADAYREWLAA